MNSVRYAHGVILVDNTFMVIGGYGNYKNEACHLNNGQFTCEEKTTTLEFYTNNPLLFAVNDTFGLC